MSRHSSAALSLESLRLNVTLSYDADSRTLRITVAEGTGAETRIVGGCSLGLLAPSEAWIVVEPEEPESATGASSSAVAETAVSNALPPVEEPAPEPSQPPFPPYELPVPCETDRRKRFERF